MAPLSLPVMNFAVKTWFWFSAFSMFSAILYMSGSMEPLFKIKMHFTLSDKISGDVDHITNLI